MIEPTIGDAHEGTQAQWDAWIAAWRQQQKKQQQPRNRKLGPVEQGQGAFEIEDEKHE